MRVLHPTNSAQQLTDTSRPVAIIGYSGHALVVIETLQAMQRKVQVYFDREEKSNNPYLLQYLGSENRPDIKHLLATYDYFIGIGDNGIRKKVQDQLSQRLTALPTRAIHPSAVISPSAQIGYGVMIAPSVTINAQAEIRDGAICNTGCIIEHECQIGSFAHIAPGAVLAGTVRVGDLAFVGANAVVRQGITIGKRAVIGAGAVVVKDVPVRSIVVGNPAKPIRQL